MEDEENYSKLTEPLSNLAKVSEIDLGINTSKLVKETFPTITKIPICMDKEYSKILTEPLSNLAKVSEIDLGINTSKLVKETFPTITKSPICMDKEYPKILTEPLSNLAKVSEIDLGINTSKLIKETLSTITKSPICMDKEYSKILTEPLSNLAKVSEIDLGINTSKLVKETLSTITKIPISMDKYYNKILTESLSNLAQMPKVSDVIDSIKINTDGTIDCLDEKNIDFEKSINEIKNMLFQKPNQTLYNKVEGFKKSHFIVFMLIIIFFINPIISSIEDYVKQELKVNVVNICNLSKYKNPKTISKKIKKPIYSEIKKQVNNKYIRSTVISNYRFVNTNSLNVRVSDSMKSYSIYKLKLGQVVKIIHKNKNWTRIEYENEDGSIIIRGWVNTRYTSRFK